MPNLHKFAQEVKYVKPDCRGFCFKVTLTPTATAFDPVAQIRISCIFFPQIAGQDVQVVVLLTSPNPEALR
jgi:hypothetical protein